MLCSGQGSTSARNTRHLALLFPHQEAPALHHLIRDRLLLRKKLARSKEFQDALASRKSAYLFHAWLLGRSWVYDETIDNVLIDFIACEITPLLPPKASNKEIITIAKENIPRTFPYAIQMPLFDYLLSDEDDQISLTADFQTSHPSGGETRQNFQ